MSIEKEPGPELKRRVPANLVYKSRSRSVAGMLQQRYGTDISSIAAATAVAYTGLVPSASGLVGVMMYDPRQGWKPWPTQFETIIPTVQVPESRFRSIAEMLRQPEWGLSDAPLIIGQGLGVSPEVAVAAGSVLLIPQLVAVILDDPPTLYHSELLNRSVSALPAALTAAGIALGIIQCLNIPSTTHAALDSAILITAVSEVVAEGILEEIRRTEH